MPEHHVPGDPIPETVHALLREHLTSFERLEIVLLLFRHPEESWTAAAVSTQTHIREELAQEALAGLEASGLVRRTDAPSPTFQFGPRAPETAGSIQTLATLYREHHAAVMSVMSMYAIERIRSGTMRAFADSFLLGKRNRDG